MANRKLGFFDTDSRQLRKIDMFMMCEFMKRNDKFNAAEIGMQRLQCKWLQNTKS